MRFESWHLLANFGAEEGRSVDLDQPVYHRLARLWSLLFSPPVRWISPEPNADISDALIDTTDPLTQYAESQSGISWLPTRSTHQLIQQLGLANANPTPDIVHSCHDKAFVLSHPSPKDPLASCSVVFHPHQLRDADALIQKLRSTIDAWPAWAQEDWTLKPRFGSSGRGRVAGTRLDVDNPILRGSLPRLMELGGFILQPFRRQRMDLSVQLDIPATPSRPIRVLGSLRPIVTTSGSYQGHRGLIGDDITSSDHPFDTLLREQAITLAERARDTGFFGPCGVDAFVYEHDGTSHLHLCEFNARWTVGHVVHGIVRRLTGKLDFLPDGFEFRLDEPFADTDGRSIPLTSLNQGMAATLKPWSR